MKTSKMPSSVRSETVYQIGFLPERVWPILSKTDWINRSLGLPPVQYEVSPADFGGTTVKAKTRFFGSELRWNEWPFEWLENEFYSVRRTFDFGPILEARLSLRFSPKDQSASAITISSEIFPRNLLGHFIARFVLNPKASRQMAQIIGHVQKFLAGERPVELPKLPKHESSESELQAGLAKLRANGQPEELLSLLERFLRDSPDVELARIRPLNVAHSWGKDDWEVLRLFLQATRVGLLDFSWEVLCPNCRSARRPLATSLAKVNRTVHCDACQIHFDAEFDKSVELKFAVNSALRPVEAETFCLAGPGSKPHVVTQIFLEAGASRSWKLPRVSFNSRLRSPEVAHSITFSSAELSQLANGRLICDPEQFRLESAPHSPVEKESFHCQVVNPNSYPVLVVLERLEWSGDILTAARITNWQEFRDLFAREVISPQEQITVGQQIVLFTDLQGSTAMYNGIGDAPAYALVRDHFRILVEAIQEHHGAVVKTIGDAVMGVFSKVHEALSAVAQMHRNLSSAQHDALGKKPLLLKSSLHLGPCLAVNANDRLDYFGTTVNLAARMVGCCKGGDMTISSELYEHADTAQFMAKFGLKAEAAEVKFRGFDEPHRVWRIMLIAA